MLEADLKLDNGHTLHYYDQGARDSDALAVFWLHGTPNIGRPPEPLFAEGARLGIRWLGYDRPGYSGSTRRPGRDIASAATDVARIADVLGIERFAVMGHSGGGPHALACAALLPDRVEAAVSGAGLAPYNAAGLDWFAGMRPSGVAGLRAALAGQDAKAAYEAAKPEFDREMFTGADWAALAGPWGWFESVVQPAIVAGPDGLIDDDIAYVTPWGFDCTAITRPVLLLHGGADRLVPHSHSAWLARRCPTAELWDQPDDGHISVLSNAPRALEWLRRQG
ncbi:pimeloyl-ACP methyl ester carboxylesterase [Pseudoduganella flava]|uniref:Alpha/beta fold hydrolase n=2 Tax=Pseudoduganella flava TaxID=871742 RepID=A0A562PRT3_9BURK|nr:alpha/beta fold hydrolase [Pseudoduganella flava]TWI46786.1 pimeloyl-ACP methyl ester carboxylesterase [Pseudoduganella flava]